MTDYEKHVLDSDPAECAKYRRQTRERALDAALSHHPRDVIALAKDCEAYLLGEDPTP